MFAVGTKVTFIDWVDGFAPIEVAGVVASSFDGKFEGEREAGYSITDEAGETHYGIDSRDVWERK